MTAETSLPRALDVGCGPEKLSGAIGIDISPNQWVDFVHDLNQAPWPLPSDHFSYMRCQHVIEHIRDLKTLSREMFRVAQDGCQIDFITPHYSSYASWGDPTHLWHFACASIPLIFEQNLDKSSFVVMKNELRFTGSILDFFGWLIYRLSRKAYDRPRSRLQ